MPLLGVVPEHLEPGGAPPVIARRPAGPIRRGLPRHPHGARLLVDGGRAAHPDRHLHLAGRGQDAHGRQPRADAGAPPRRGCCSSTPTCARARPTRLLKARRTPGLSDVLVGKAKPSEVIQQSVGGAIARVPARAAPPSRARRTSSRRARSPASSTACGSSTTGSSIDSPPVGAVAEPLILAPLSDGVIVVAGAEMVPRKAVVHTLERIADTGARIVGVVLNRAQMREALVLLQALLRPLLRPLLRQARRQTTSCRVHGSSARKRRRLEPVGSVEAAGGLRAGARAGGRQELRIGRVALPRERDPGPAPIHRTYRPVPIGCGVCDSATTCETRKLSHDRIAEHHFSRPAQCESAQLPRQSHVLLSLPRNTFTWRRTRALQSARISRAPHIVDSHHTASRGPPTLLESPAGRALGSCSR